MEDTSREIAERQHIYWMSLSEPERFRRCGELFALAKQAARERAPDGLTEDEEMWFVVREMYGDEFANMMRTAKDE